MRSGRPSPTFDARPRNRRCEENLYPNLIQFETGKHQFEEALSPRRFDLLVETASVIDMPADKVLIAQAFRSIVASSFV
jgi:hypothetical protein